MSTAFPGSENQQPQNPYDTTSSSDKHLTVPDEKKKGGCLKWGGIGLGVVILLAIVGSCGGEETPDNGTVMSSSPAEKSEDSVAPNEDAAENTNSDTEASDGNDAVADHTPPSAETQKDDSEKPQDVPREYKNALRSAQTYTKMSGFSYDGLYEQLTSEYGEGYPAEAAQYALDNLDVDWNEQALKSAKNYQEIMPMSDSQLFDQLTSDYGEKFTPEQAQYAIDHLDD
ncbi:Host cell surface-exposed lipoprotein [Corynebacterium imitans]|uniref:Host cell surface-exposed lipoprotein n=1 Tax=Corynebacterium imitans TaxID=156978 RepID=A0A239ZAZ0_9CORY|nr:Ltp family lipoprotein [Corynebacterium imitans]SNV68047.1 Host cell surface-exposed lipoprotein [Corynebacterium imitans]